MQRRSLPGAPLFETNMALAPLPKTHSALITEHLELEQSTTVFRGALTTLEGRLSKSQNRQAALTALVARQGQCLQHMRENAAEGLVVSLVEFGLMKKRYVGHRQGLVETAALIKEIKNELAARRANLKMAEERLKLLLAELNKWGRVLPWKKSL